MFFSGGGQAGVVEAFDSASGCLGGLLVLTLLESDMLWITFVHQNCSLGGADASDTGAPFLDLHLSVLSGVCDRHCGFGFDIVYFPGLDGGVTRRASCGMCISRLAGFVGLVCVWSCGWFRCSRLVFDSRVSLAELSVSLASGDFFRILSTTL